MAEGVCSDFPEKFWIFKTKVLSIAANVAECFYTVNPYERKQIFFFESTFTRNHRNKFIIIISVLFIIFYFIFVVVVLQYSNRFYLKEEGRKRSVKM